MDKTLQEMQIEVAQYWAGVEEMNGCHWMLVVGTPVQEEWRLIEDTRETFTRIIHVCDAEELRLLKADFKDVNGWKYEILPYLKIEDGNHWSSAAILVRSGIMPDTVKNNLLSIVLDLFPNETRKMMALSCSPQYGEWIKFTSEYHRALMSWNQELANNLTIQWLHKNAHDVWLKGMELCN